MGIMEVDRFVKYYKLNDTLTCAKYENLPSGLYLQTEEALNIDTYKKHH
jgi:hypothetical protein